MFSFLTKFLTKFKANSNPIPIRSSAEEILDMRMNLIEEHLYLGDYNAAKNLQQLKALDIKYVLSVFNDDLNEAKLDSITYKKIDVEDYHLADLITYFSEANEFIARAQNTKQNVFVHCHMGYSRSATIVVAFIMHKYKMPFQQAFDLVNDRRSIGPNAGFVTQLKIYEEMNFTIDSNNRHFRRNLVQTLLNSESFWCTKRENQIEIYYKKREYFEGLTESLDLGHNYLCAGCGFKLFNEIHIIQNEIPKDQEINLKTSCQWVYIEPQKWMKELTQPFESMTCLVIRCPQCQKYLIEHKKLFMPYVCGCLLHDMIGSCLRFRIDTQNFKIE